MLPVMPLSLSAGGGTSGASSAGQLANDLTMPFNFDQSGWAINMHGNGVTQSPTGNTGANAIAQPGVLGSLLGSGSMPLLLIGGAGLFLLLRK